MIHGAMRSQQPPSTPMGRGIPPTSNTGMIRMETGFGSDRFTNNQTGAIMRRRSSHE